MSMSLNRAQLIGNLTRDPEVRQTTSGRTVVNFSVATSSRWKGDDGQYQERSEFHNIVVWGRLAEICGQYLRKGSKIFIEGRLQTRDWEGKDGVKRYRTEIVAESMIMLDRKGAPTQGGFNAGRESAGLAAPASAPATSPAMGAKEAPTQEIAVEDLPF